MFRVPTIHDSITTKKAITIDAHEVIIVYRHNGEASERTVERYLEYGPKMFIPTSKEWYVFLPYMHMHKNSCFFM